jgi:hypothetical protein
MNAEISTKQVWSHEPPGELQDTVETGWGHLVDMWQNSSQQVVSTSVNASFVQVP